MFIKDTKQEDTQYGFFNDLQGTLSRQAEFSISELIPLLEQQLTVTLDKTYQIEAFLVGFEGSSNIATYFFAFPQKDSDSYINAYFYHDSEKTDKRQLVIAKTAKTTCTISEVDPVEVDSKEILTCYEKQFLDMQKDPETFMIATMTDENSISSKEAIRFLTYNQYPKRRCLFDGGIFCYPEKLDFLGDTIEKFAMDKVKEANAKEELGKTNQLQKKIPTI